MERSLQGSATATKPFLNLWGSVLHHGKQPGALCIRALCIVALVLLYGNLLTSRLQPRVSSAAGEGGAEADCDRSEYLLHLEGRLANCEGEFDEKRKAGFMNSAFGEKCRAPEATLQRLLAYDTRHECPDDWLLGQDLLFKYTCLNLPRRACFSPMPKKYSEPLPQNMSLWSIPADGNVRWRKYECKSFRCLNERTRGDCRECFNLDTSERKRFLERSRDLLDIPGVLALKNGSIRVGLDIGGGTGTFAARMAEYNVTIASTGMNSGAPFLETVALRGLVPLHVPHLQRLPFFDNALDLIHSLHSVHELSPNDFELMLYDWDRVLRPGGILWLQNFYGPVDGVAEKAKLLMAFKYKVHEWRPTTNGNMSRFTTVMEKPMPN